jgi:S1-C subfamily serine protease
MLKIIVLFCVLNVSTARDSVVVVSGKGAGFLVSKDTVVTAAHVARGKNEVEIIFKNGVKMTAKRVLTDTSKDIVILKLPEEIDLPVFKIAKAELGEKIIAIGHPYSYRWSLSSGIISHENRSVTMPTGVEIDGLLQVDAPINPGNSGGPILNSKGEVVGMIIALRDGGAGISWALSGKDIKEVLRRITK